MAIVSHPTSGVSTPPTSTPSAENYYNERPRVSFTDGSIAGAVKARKRYPCGSHMADRHYIEPGDHYIANALPPDNPDICNSGWLHLRICLDCCPIKFLDTRPLSQHDGEAGA